MRSFVWLGRPDRPSSPPESSRSTGGRRLAAALLCLSLLALSFPSLAPQAAATEVQTNCPGPRTGDKKVTGGRWTYEKDNIYGLGCLDAQVSAAYAHSATSAASAAEDGSKLYAFRVSSRIAPGLKGKPHAEYFFFHVTLGGSAKIGEDYEFVYRSGNQLGAPLSRVGSTGNLYGGIVFDSSKMHVLRETLRGARSTVTSAYFFRILDDDEVESDETVTFTISYHDPQLRGGGAADYQIGTATATFTIRNDDVAPTAQKPRVAIKAGQSPITEGASATFTVTATPAPAADTKVAVTVSEKSGSDFVASDDEGATTVTIPANRTEATLTVATTGDTVNEPDGRVTARLGAGTGYTVSVAKTATVNVADDDAPAVASCVSASLRAAVEGYIGETQYGAAHVARWQKALKGLDGAAGGMTGSEARTMETTFSAGRWTPVAEAIECLEKNPAPATLPELSLSAGSAVDEGGRAAFTVTANPAPQADLTVNFTVVQSGDWLDAPGAGARTVALAAGATSVTVSLATLDDGTDEADGSVSVTIDAGTSYAIAAGQGSGTVAVRDNDEPVVSVAAGAGVTEGTAATFTVTASPTPHAPLEVALTVSQSGDFAASGETGAKTVTVPTSGSVTLEVPTVNDDKDEPDGSIAATLDAGTGYTVAAPPANAAQVAVSDDDAPAVASCVPASLRADVEGYIGETHYGAAHVARWQKALKGLDGEPGGMTGTEARTMETTFSAHRWTPVAEAIECLEEKPEPVPVPEVTVSGGGGVTEGALASFTVTASPAPAAPLQVTLTVSQGGDFAAAGETGTRTVTVPTGSSVGVDIPTVDDGQDEPDGSVTVTVDPGTGYTVGGTAATAVTVADNDAGSLPELSLSAGAAVDEGGNAAFTITANPAPQADITIAYTVAEGGAVLAAPGAGSRTATLAAGKTSVALAVATVDDGVDEADGSVSVTLDAGTGYTVAAGAGSATVAVRDNDEPVVSVAAGAAVTEGTSASFTVTADPVPHAPLEVALTVSQDGDFAASGGTGAKTVTVPVAGSVTLEVATENDEKDEADGSVTATLDAGTGYAVAAAPGNAASVEVRDDDAAAGVPTLSAGDATGSESDRQVRFTVRLSRAVDRHMWVYARTRDSTPVSAEAGRDYAAVRNRVVHFRPGETEHTVQVYIVDDSHDEDPETFELVLANVYVVGAPQGSVVIGDAVAVGTIVNDDPMPAAWLSRFGRTAAEQALDGIAGRMAAPRTAGVQGTIAGQALNLDPDKSPGLLSGAGGNDSGGSDGPGGAPNGNTALGSPSGSLSAAQSDVARAFGAANGGLGTGRDAFGRDAQAFGFSNGGGAQSSTMTAREAMLGSSFTATGETDATGGSLAFWGRAAQSSFDGREGTFSLDGEATTALLGADYARDRWMVGLALMQTSGKGVYADQETGSVRCPQRLDAETRRVLCGEAIREGDGTAEASLTAAVPYASLQVSQRLKLWGAAGYGTGKVTLKPDHGSGSGAGPGGTLKANIAWTMAALGLRGDVIAPPKEGSGPALAVTSDALWARTSSDKTHELAASDSDVTRLRIGLEGSYRIALEQGGSVTPKLELGARHDGGDAETGSGLELGGGIAWMDPALGLILDLSGRTLVTHDADDLKDRGYSASLAWDPDPATKRGPSLTLTQDWGGQAQGGLDALFRADPLSDRAGGGAATARWQAEAAYGFPAFSGRFTGSPHVGLGLATGVRDYSLGWRLTPAANANAPDLSFDLTATRRENDGAEPEHTVGFEAIARW